MFANEAGRNYVEAIKGSVAQHPRDPELRARYAEALLQQGRPSSAHGQIEIALAIAPDDPGIVSRAASVMFHLGEFEISQRYVIRAGNLVGRADVEKERRR